MAGLHGHAGVDQALDCLAADPESEVDLMPGADFAGINRDACVACSGRLHQNPGWRNRRCLAVAAGAQSEGEAGSGKSWNERAGEHRLGTRMNAAMIMNDRSVTQQFPRLDGGVVTIRSMNTILSTFAGLDFLASTVLMLDEGLVVRYINPAGENLLAVSLRSVAGKPLSAVCTCSAILQGALDNALNNNWGYTGQNIELKRSDGELLHINCTVTPLRPELAAGVRLLLELQPIEQQLAATREEHLIEQQKATRELIRNLAHEIKNPLGGIRGAAQLLEHELGNPSLREYTQVIIKEADRLRDLVQRLLTPHRTMLPTTVNIHEILERVRSLLTAEFPGSLAMRRDYDTSLPELVGDREQLIQAVLNIARNAAQAMRGEGEIVLRTRVLRQVTLAKKRYRLALDIKVIDNGPGIPETVRERMFYPLVSGREGGSGLGLTIAQNFVQHHRGTIDCSSRPGQTIFTIRLPV